jgi:uncharacterized protein with GYD domain
MAEYLVEHYVPGSSAQQLEQATARLQAAAKEMSCEGTPVRYLRGVFLREDATCLHLFEADSLAAVGEASRRAELDGGSEQIRRFRRLIPGPRTPCVDRDGDDPRGALTMAAYVVETYLSRQGAQDLRSIEERVRRAAEDLTREGVHVRHVQSVFVPDDEMCFHFFDAASAAGVRAAGERAAIAFDRVSEAMYGNEFPPSQKTPPLFERILSAPSEAGAINSTEERA